MDYIKQNLDIINGNIKKAAEKSCIKFEDITLVAVTKTVSIEKLRYAQTIGLNIFGENKAQELELKYGDIENINWHFIGTLQSNKIKKVIDRVVLIQSVSSIKLAEAINEQAVKHNKIMDILLEVNIGEEDSKHGFSSANIIQSALVISKFENIKIKGLMTIAPYVENPEDNRKLFKEMKRLNDAVAKELGIENPILSMGMSNDYEVAIEEGATMVRVGARLFGVR